MVWSFIAVSWGLLAPDLHHQQDSALVVPPPAATCRPVGAVPDSACAGFVGPSWITTNALPPYPPLLLDAGIQHVEDFLVHVDSLGAVAGIAYRDSLTTRAKLQRAFRSPFLGSARTWRFVPAMSGDHPVSSTVRVVAIWSRGECVERGKPDTVTSSARIGIAALVIEIAACVPPPPLRSVIHIH